MHRRRDTPACPQLSSVEDWPRRDFRDKPASGYVDEVTVVEASQSIDVGSLRSSASTAASISSGMPSAVAKSFPVPNGIPRRSLSRSRP